MSTHLGRLRRKGALPLHGALPRPIYCSANYASSHPIVVITRGYSDGLEKKGAEEKTREESGPTTQETPENGEAKRGSSAASKQHGREAEQPPTYAPYVRRGSAINFAWPGQEHFQTGRRDGPALSADNWEDHADARIEEFTELPYKLFGANQHMEFHAEFKKELTQLLRSYRAPIMYAFAYGSGVFPQAKAGSRVVSDEEYRTVHPHPSTALKEVQASGPRSIDLIFGVSHTQHWHSLNIRQHPDHYSFMKRFGSGLVSITQDRWGAGVYFNPYITQNGLQIKYGVTTLDNLCTDLLSWNNLYLAGRLQKPVKILRDHPRVRLANQVNLLSAVRAALLLLPPHFTERQLYATIAGLSYLGDPRMSLPTESPSKVTDIVDNNMLSFRQLYAPLIETLPNVEFVGISPGNLASSSPDPDEAFHLEQDMDPIKRGNMVRRLPSAFRTRLYFQYQKKFMVPSSEFDAMIQQTAREEAEAVSSGSSSFKQTVGGGFERRIANDDASELQTIVRRVIQQTVYWPAAAQSIKGIFTAGPARAARYMLEKWRKYRAGKAKLAAKSKSEDK